MNVNRVCAQCETRGVFKFITFGKLTDYSQCEPSNGYFLFVQIKSERELDKLKGLRLVELWLEGNPLCQHFKDQAMYIRLVEHKPP